ncbi:hypothetical protein GCM10025880_57050 [Methylorubrum aminovorans]|nr:hypothetical protein [Methylorubrum aminovorans]GMA79288.1 hypothetical protein GCM10025880_57050 [Methylorubrum aminovorans]
MLEKFLEAKTRNPYYNKEARDTWADFKAFCGGRAMKDCTRTDGRAYAEHLRAKGAKNATIVKKINYLRAPLTHDPEFLATNINPFERAIIHVDDAKEVLPLTEDEVKLCRDHMLPKLGPNERLLWLLCATMGMRHSEAYTIESEDVEDGIRFVYIAEDDENGKRRGKTKVSKRRVPLPDCLLPYLPEKITGPLFTDSCKNVSKNLLRAFRRVGITDTNKNVYSLRHRAHDRLRNMAGMTPDIERRIVGHRGARKDSHDNYGNGHAMRVLKPFVDQIGY